MRYLLTSCTQTPRDLQILLKPFPQSLIARSSSLLLSRKTYIYINIGLLGCRHCTLLRHPAGWPRLGNAHKTGLAVAVSSLLHTPAVPSPSIPHPTRVPLLAGRYREDTGGPDSLAKRCPHQQYGHACRHPQTQPVSPGCHCRYHCSAIKILLKALPCLPLTS